MLKFTNNAHKQSSRTPFTHCQSNPKEGANWKFWRLSGRLLVQNEVINAKIY